MLSEDKIIVLYPIVDDMLKGLHHYKDTRIHFSDAEVITTAFVVLYFGGHLDHARGFMKRHMPRVLEKSRFCRRLHRLSNLLISLFYWLGKDLKICRWSRTILSRNKVTICAPACTIT